MISTHLFLVGPMGAGKSTIGKQLASVLGRPFFDIDLLERKQDLVHGILGLKEEN